MLPSLDFAIISYCEPKCAISVDFAPIITELYDGNGSAMPTQHKKFVINCLLGCLDQHKRTRRSAEWYEDVDEARANNSDKYFNPTVLTMNGSEWEEDIARKKLEIQIESLKLKLEQTNINEASKRDCDAHSIQSDIQRKQDELERSHKSDYLEKLESIIASEKDPQNTGKRYNADIIDEVEALQNLVKAQGLDDEQRDKILYYYWNWENYTNSAKEETSNDDEEQFYNELDEDMIESLNKCSESLSKHEQADSWRRFTSEELKAKKHIYIVQTNKTTHHMTDGFLPIALLKYQLQRMVVLRMWKQIEDSANLVPIGVKTDCIFVASK